MKPLTTEQIKEFIRVIEETRERELNCSECQSCVGELAERQLAGLPLDQALARVGSTCRFARSAARNFSRWKESCVKAGENYCWDVLVQ